MLNYKTRVLHPAAVAVSMLLWCMLYSAYMMFIVFVLSPQIYESIPISSSGSVMYKDNGNERDFGRFGSIVNALKKKEWFMGNVAAWILYDSDDSDSPEDFATEDLIVHYAGKRAVGA